MTMHLLSRLLAIVCGVPMQIMGGAFFALAFNIYQMEIRGVSCPDHLARDIFFIGLLVIAGGLFFALAFLLWRVS